MQGLRLGQLARRGRRRSIFPPAPRAAVRRSAGRPAQPRLPHQRAPRVGVLRQQSLVGASAGGVWRSPPARAPADNAAARASGRRRPGRAAAASASSGLRSRSRRRPMISCASGEPACAPSSRSASAPLAARQRQQRLGAPDHRRQLAPGGHVGQQLLGAADLGLLRPAAQKRQQQQLGRGRPHLRRRGFSPAAVRIASAAPAGTPGSGRGPARPGRAPAPWRTAGPLLRSGSSEHPRRPQHQPTSPRGRSTSLRGRGAGASSTKAVARRRGGAGRGRRRAGRIRGSAAGRPPVSHGGALGRASAARSRWCSRAYPGSG